MFNPTGDPNDPLYWRASLLLNGSPFKDDDGLSGIPEPESVTKGMVTVYPNPATDHITISVDNAEEFMQFNVRLYNINGMLVYQGLNSNNDIIDLGNLGLNSGIYFVHIETDDFVEIVKIIFSE